MSLGLEIKRLYACVDNMHNMCSGKFIAGYGGMRWLMICSCCCHLPKELRESEIVPNGSNEGGS